MSDLIAVTGATGTVGSHVLKLLLDQGQNVRALVRNPDAIKEAHAIEFDFEKKESFKSALKWVDKLVLIIPEHRTDVSEFLKNAAHVAQVVIISGVSANNRKTSPLAELEGAVYRARLPYTTLRCSWFMQNFITFWGNDIKERSLIEMPFGDAKSSVIDVRDIALCASAVLEDERHLNKVYTLTGPQALSYAEMCATLSEELGKQIRYQSIEDQTQESELKLLFQEVREGKTAHISPWVEKISGYPPLTFQQFVVDHKKQWQ